MKTEVSQALQRLANSGIRLRGTAVFTTPGGKQLVVTPGPGGYAYEESEVR